MYHLLTPFLLLAILALLIAGIIVFRSIASFGRNLRFHLNSSVPTGSQLDNTAPQPTPGEWAKQEIARIHSEMDLTLNRISDSVISLDREWRYTFLNDAALQTNPGGRESCLGKVIWDVHPDARGTIFFEKAMEAMQNREVVELEFYYAHLDSWFAVRIYPSEDGVTIFRRDITQQKKAWEEVRRKEKRFEAIIRHSTDGLTLVGNDGAILDISPTGEKMLGYQRDKLVGTPWPNGVHPEDLPLVKDAFEGILHDPSSVRTIEYRHLMPDGAVKWVECSCNNLLAEPYLHAVVFNYRDITERKKAAARILAESNLSDTIINSLPGVFYLLSKDGKFLRWNRNFEEISGYQPEDIRRMRPTDFISPFEHATLMEKIENVFVTGEDFAQLGLLAKSGKAIPYLFTGKSIIYEGEPCLVGVGLDLSERIMAQEQIRRTTDQLRALAAHLENVREEERTDIARDIHDDLGQQLTAVKIALFRLSERVAGDVDTSKAIERIIDMTGTGIESIRRISTRLRPAVLDDLGLVEAMKWHIEEFERRFSIPVTAEFSSSAEILDPEISTHLFRIFQEALTNIARHASATRVEIKFHSTAGRVYLRVLDNGRGLDPAESRSKHHLGLLGIKERTREMGGRFSINSEPGKGTVIEIEAPTAKNDRNSCVF
ncbi:MAG TPA: PAS domain S-box protein [Puia sp.]|uniref:sensor histidine kinase n=1 Tax=Puia sp. TaxID=2045100 RepID=UPI002BA76D49|nr:PAS domain S-box protein [Puia sp.]HVU94405.1 PAS domain S-box protein [Puia sp.]